MGFLRVVVANELRSYREAIARAMSIARPDIEVYETEPEELNWEVARLRPDFVMCSRVTSVVELRVPVWIELYPNCQAPSRVGVRGKITTLNSVQLADLLALLDQARDLTTLS